jgi:hypothetical protein
MAICATAYSLLRRAERDRQEGEPESLPAVRYAITDHQIGRGDRCYSARRDTQFELTQPPAGSRTRRGRR